MSKKINVDKVFGSLSACLQSPECDDGPGPYSSRKPSLTGRASNSLQAK